MRTNATLHFTRRRKPIIILAVVNLAPTLVSILLLASSHVQKPDEFVARGVIDGTVADQEGRQAAGICLTAAPMGVPLGTQLPTTKTDVNGKYDLRTSLGGADSQSMPRMRRRVFKLQYEPPR